MKKFTFYSFLFFCFFACSSSKQVAIKQTAAIDLRQHVVSIWKSIIPCAACPGIEYRLHLKKNDSFEERMEYLERNVKPFRSEGTWQISSDDIITLKDKEEKGISFLKMDR